MKKRHRRKPTNDFPATKQDLYTYESLDPLENDAALERFIEAERNAFREEWYRYITEYD